MTYFCVQAVSRKKIEGVKLFRLREFGPARGFEGYSQGRSDGGYWGGGGVVNPPTFLKLTYSEIWVGHSENKGDNRLGSTNEIYLLNRNY